MMLDVNPETVCRLIQLAREFHVQEQVIIPEMKGNPSGDWALQTLASHTDDMTFREFKSIIQDLEPRQQQQITALLWVGRGDYTVEEWNDVLEQASDEWSPNTAEYLIAHPLLAEYLTDGLALFDHSCDE